jgi:hypothetical protein
MICSCLVFVLKVTRHVMFLLLKRHVLFYFCFVFVMPMSCRCFVLVMWLVLTQFRAVEGIGGEVQDGSCHTKALRAFC